MALIGTPCRWEMMLSESPGITRTVTDGFCTDGAPTMGATPLTAVMLEQAQAGSMIVKAKTARVDARQFFKSESANMGGLEQWGAKSVLWLPFE
jgi:hypothetical protein